MAEPAAGTSPLGSTSIVQDPTPRVPSPVSSDRRTSISSGTTLPKNDVPGWPSAVPEQEQEQREQGQVQGPSPPTVNGVALATAATAIAAAAAAAATATASQSRAASPTPGPDTPQSHAHPSTPKPHAVSVTTVNGQVAPPPPTPAPGPGTSSAVSSASNPATGVAGARSKEQFLRWRDPMTVKYDSGSGHAQPGKLQPSNPSPQLKQEHAQPQTQAVQQPGQQSQPQPQQFSTPPSRQLQSQPLPQPQLPVLQTQAQHQQNLQPSHSQHAQQQLHQQPQYIQVSHQQAHHSHPQSYPQPVHPQLNHSQPLHPPPPPPQAAATALPPLHHQHPHPSHLPIHRPPSGRPLATQTRSKPVIMDPPRKASPQIKGFPSPGPGADHPRRNPKFVDDCTRMTYAVQQSLPEAVRRTVRDHWEKCLLGSEFHQAFILNASIHHAGPSITRRAVQDFGEKMIQESKAELIGHFKTEDLDQIAHLIIEKASDSFLDKCLAKRLQTIEAKPLINALAKAERLGYEPGDIVEGDQHEHVIPQEAFPGAAAAAAATASGANGVAPSRPVSHPPQPQPQQYPPHQQLQCLRCFRTFTQPPAYEHHTAFSVCSQIPPTNKGFEHSCPYCGQGFTRLDELQTHLENRVCLTPNKASRGPGRPARSAPPTQPNPVSILPSVNQTPGLNGYNFSYDPAQATPTHRSKAPRSSVGTPNSVASPNPSDPYAHLTPEKLEAMNQELQNAEVTYAPRFAEAEAIADENERRARIEGLRNSFGTKQSMIRKKYGVRLRERRTKAEIAAERERLGLKKAEREKAKAIIAKQQLAAAANASSQLPPAAGSTGWTAANTTQAAQGIWDDHDAKRRRLDGTGGYQAHSNSLGDDTPTPKILSVSQLGAGLSGTPATAELQDPTRPPQSAQQAGEQRQQTAPEIVTLDSESPSPNSGENPAERAVSISDDASRRASLQQSTTVSPRPAETTQPGANVMDVDSDSSDDDEDIPSTLPAHVRSTLGQQTYGLHA